MIIKQEFFYIKIFHFSLAPGANFFKSQFLKTGFFVSAGRRKNR